MNLTNIACVIEKAKKNIAVLQKQKVLDKNLVYRYVYKAPPKLSAKVKPGPKKDIARENIKSPEFFKNSIKIQLTHRAKQFKNYKDFEDYVKLRKVAIFDPKTIPTVSTKDLKEKQILSLFHEKGTGEIDPVAENKTLSINGRNWDVDAYIDEEHNDLICVLRDHPTLNQLGVWFGDMILKTRLGKNDWKSVATLTKYDRPIYASLAPLQIKNITGKSLRSIFNQAHKQEDNHGRNKILSQ